MMNSSFFSLLFLVARVVLSRPCCVLHLVFMDLTGASLPNCNASCRNLMLDVRRTPCTSLQVKRVGSCIDHVTCTGTTKTKLSSPRKGLIVIHCWLLAHIAHITLWLFFHR